MSRIYDAIRQAEQSRAKSELESGNGASVMELEDRRCGRRWELGIHITVYGRALDEQPFYEEVKAYSVNAGGGMVLLGVPVYDGQDLLLINNRTSQEQVCQVVHSHIRDVQTSEVAVTFLTPNADFWQIPETSA